jgi:hypothetical protein
MAGISEGKVRGQPVILPARAFRFEIEAILTSPKNQIWGFDPFCPGPRWQARDIFQYASHLPPKLEQNGLKPRTHL